MSRGGGISLRKDGLYVVRVTDPVTGKRVARYAKTEPEARKLLRQMQARTENGEPAADARMTLRAYSAWWFEHRAGRSRSDGTIGEYASRMNVHVLPHIGGLKIGEVTELDIEAVLDRMAAAGKSQSTIKATRNALSAMFTDAVRGKLLRSNPAKGAVMPENAAEGTPRTVPTTSEVRALLDATSGTEIGRLALVVAYTGCRIGEALASTWDQVDLDAGTWTIDRTLTRDRHGRTIVGERTKTRQARTLALEPAALAMLREQRRHVTAARLASRVWDDPGEWVWPTSWGTHRDPSNTRDDLRAAAPDWPYGWHELRHYLASVGLLDAGLPMAALSKYLGHASTRTTQDVYGHLIAETSHAIGGSITRALGT